MQNIQHFYYFATQYKNLKLLFYSPPHLNIISASYLMYLIYMHNLTTIIINDSETQ